MTNAQQPDDETKCDDGGESYDAEGIKLELFAAWMLVHPDGTRQQFDDEWVAMTNAARASSATTASAPSSWEDDPDVLKRRMFEEWIAAHPGGTRDAFEAEWRALTASSGI